MTTRATPPPKRFRSGPPRRHDSQAPRRRVEQQVGSRASSARQKTPISERREASKILQLHMGAVQSKGLVDCADERSDGYAGPDGERSPVMLVVVNVHMPDDGGQAGDRRAGEKRIPGELLSSNPLADPGVCGGPLLSLKLVGAEARCRGTFSILGGHIQPTIPVAVTVVHDEPSIHLVEKRNAYVRGKCYDDLAVGFGCHSKRGFRCRGPYLRNRQGSDLVGIAGNALTGPSDGKEASRPAPTAMDVTHFGSCRIVDWAIWGSPLILGGGAGKVAFTRSLIGN